jgi:D-alanyl-D-alanine carboxypeptidase
MKQAVLALCLTLLAAGATLAGPDSPRETPQRLTAVETEAAKAGAPFRIFSSWLAALNSDDASRHQQFLEQHYARGAEGGLVRLRENSHGLELRALEEATATRIVGLVQERDSDNFLRFTVVVAPDRPDFIQDLQIFYVPRPADFPPPRMTEAQIFAGLDAKLARDAAADRFSGVVLVTKHGKPVYHAAVGLANRDEKIANTLDTRFDLGSMNKMFTATAILQLVQSGKVRLTDPVGKYLTDYPNAEVATKVTIEHLLTHTGGTGNIFGPEFDAHRNELKTHADYLKLFGARAPAFEPGSRFEYSNYGMLMLGAVIERVTGKSYYDYVEQQIYRPAGMKHTGSEPLEVHGDDSAIGYMRPPGGDGVPRPNIALMAWRGNAAGGGFSTVGDLAKFAAALTANKLLSPANTRLLTTGKVDAPSGGRYAYGFLDRRATEGWFGHDGGAPGVNGILMIFPESEYVVAVLSNFDPPFAGRVGSYLALRLRNRSDAATSSPP